MKIDTVLIVDDNEGDQLLVRLAVEEYDPSITIYVAYDGQEALDLIDSLDEDPNLIFLDINMPGMNGHEFLVEYHKTQHTGCVITMLTSSDQESDKALSMTYPLVKKYTIKPLSVKDIGDIVSKEFGKDER